MVGRWTLDGWRSGCSRARWRTSVCLSEPHARLTVPTWFAQLPEKWKILYTLNKSLGTASRPLAWWVKTLSYNIKPIETNLTCVRARGARQLYFQNFSSGSIGWLIDVVHRPRARAFRMQGWPSSRANLRRLKANN